MGSPAAGGKGQTHAFGTAFSMGRDRDGRTNRLAQFKV